MSPETVYNITANKKELEDGDLADFCAQHLYAYSFAKIIVLQLLRNDISVIDDYFVSSYYEIAKKYIIHTLLTNEEVFPEILKIDKRNISDVFCKLIDSGAHMPVYDSLLRAPTARANAFIIALQEKKLLDYYILEFVQETSFLHMAAKICFSSDIIERYFPLEIVDDNNLPVKMAICKDNKGKLPLYYAIESRSVGMIEFLLARQIQQLTKNKNKFKTKKFDSVIHFYQKTCVKFTDKVKFLHKLNDSAISEISDLFDEVLSMHPVKNKFACMYLLMIYHICCWHDNLQNTFLSNRFIKDIFSEQSKILVDKYEQAKSLIPILQEKILDFDIKLIYPAKPIDKAQLELLNKKTVINKPKKRKKNRFHSRKNTQIDNKIEQIIKTKQNNERKKQVVYYQAAGTVASKIEMISNHNYHKQITAPKDRAMIESKRAQATGTIYNYQHAVNVSKQAAIFSLFGFAKPFLKKDSIMKYRIAKRQVKDLYQFLRSKNINLNLPESLQDRLFKNNKTIKLYSAYDNQDSKLFGRIESAREVYQHIEMAKERLTEIGAYSQTHIHASVVKLIANKLAPLSMAISDAVHRIDAKHEKTELLKAQRTLHYYIREISHAYLEHKYRIRETDADQENHVNHARQYGHPV